MEQLTTTPFGQRPVTAGMLQQASAVRAAAEIPHCDKWQLFRSLCTARLRFNLSDRDLTVLNALLSFHKGTSLSDNASLVVFPSNRALGERAHGMAESTLRRHLAALVRSGLICRHDSPNGKRYAARDRDGEIIRAFGFDLRPLLQHARQITDTAIEVQADAAHLKRLREEVTLLNRDAVKLAEYGVEVGISAPWQTLQDELVEISKHKRRKLGHDLLSQLGDKLRTLLQRIRHYLFKAEDMSGSDGETERHYQNSNKDSYESESVLEIDAAGTDGASLSPAPSDEPTALEPNSRQPNLPLGLVLKACPDILPYASHPVQHWHELVGLMASVRGYMGISPDAWAEAQRVMGAEVAAITVAAILQRVDDIRSPGGYLRSLTSKSAAGGFSPGPMVMALLSPAKQA
ncbi:MAG: replication initiation protein [Rhodobacteraceae bacterium]|nr:MAG: replication initiation protein [Paracoccaceae bacterium]